MSRGKYAAKAATRRAELEVSTDLASYQRQIVKLTAENRELRERLTAQQKAAAAVERRLRAERDEGVAPQVEALSLTLQQAIDERDFARRMHAEREKRFRTAAHRVLGHFHSEHGMTAVEAAEAMAALMGRVALRLDDKKDSELGLQRDDLSPDARGRIQVARGKRRAP